MTNIYLNYLYFLKRVSSKFKGFILYMGFFMLIGTKKSKSSFPYYEIRLLTSKQSFSNDSFLFILLNKASFLTNKALNCPPVSEL